MTAPLSSLAELADERFTEAQRAKVAEFEAAPEPPESSPVVVAMLALADSWTYKGEFGWGAWQEGQGPDQEGLILDHAAAEIRRALATALDGKP